jgi:hypothetical protein
MTNILDITSDALNTYFQVIKHKGYLKKSEVNKVLIISFIEEILDAKFCDFITEDDYNSIINAINRICSNSSIVKFPSFDVYTDLIQDIRIYNNCRMTEDNNLRMSQSGNVRVAI